VSDGRVEKPDSPLSISDLDHLAEACRERYLTARPWPHVILEDLIDPAAIAASEAQELERALGLRVHSENRMIKAESPQVVGQAAKAILDSLLTHQFVDFLEKLTAISGLQTDPTHEWGGIHVCPPGTSQVIHRDFRLHPKTGLYHRVNVIVYLNSDWPQAYGGELEMWSPLTHECGQKVLPAAGKVVIFETTPDTCHGVPDPVRCPQGRARLSLASYYYTESPGPTDRREPIVFSPRRPQDAWHLRIKPLNDIATTLRNQTRELLRGRRSNR
jgi:2OG-Fe(II) oxygenase superfamily